MNNDIDLLKKVASVLGLNVKGLYTNIDDEPIGLVIGKKGAKPKTFWNPLIEDGAAFQLQVHLGMCVECNPPKHKAHVKASYPGTNIWVMVQKKDDCLNATRRAVTILASRYSEAQLQLEGL